MLKIGDKVIVIKPNRIAGEKAVIIEKDFGNDDTPYGSGGYERYKVSIDGEIYPQYIPDTWLEKYE